MDAPILGSKPRYLKRNPIFNFLLLIIDSLLIALPRSEVDISLIKPKRILIVNCAHLGDVVGSTSVLPILKSAFPLAQIGFLVGSWSCPILLNHPMINFIHTVDHWRLNRSHDGFFKKVRHYLATRKTALAEIKNCHYDVAIDLYTYFPNMIPLLWQTGIPIRIGYESSGFGALLTSAVRFAEESRNVVLYQSDLLRQLPISEIHFKKQYSILANPDSQAESELCQLLKVASVNSVKYRVIHMGTGLRAKEWPLESWRFLSKRLVDDGHLLLFTGAGKREYENIEYVMRDLPNCINSCNQLTWSGYIAAIRFAEILYGADSLSAHVAAAFKTPSVIAYSGITDIERFKPWGKNYAAVSIPLECSPCRKRHGCDEMQCMIGISPNAMFDAGNKLINL